MFPVCTAMIAKQSLTGLWVPAHYNINSVNKNLLRLLEVKCRQNYGGCIAIFLITCMQTQFEAHNKGSCRCVGTHMNMNSFLQSIQHAMP